MAQHQARNIPPELLPLIFRNLLPDAPAKSWHCDPWDTDTAFIVKRDLWKEENAICRKTLVSAMMASPAFREPALDALWCALPPNRYMELLRFLPAVRLVGPMGRRCYQVDGTNDPTDLTRFGERAARVRMFSYDLSSQDDYCVDDAVWEHIWQSLGARQPIFPRLEVLEFRLSKGDSTVAERFLAPRLRHLHLIAPVRSQSASKPQVSEDNAYAFLMRMAMAKCPRLPVLRLSGGLVYDQSFARFLVPFHSLTALELPARHGPIYPALTIVSRLPRLSHLQIHTPGPFEEDLCAKQPITFPVLSNLHLHDFPELVMGVLSIMHLPVIKSLNITCLINSEDGDESRINELFAALQCSPLNQDTLRSVYCTLVEDHTIAGTEWTAVSWNTFLTQLLPFRNLDTIFIKAPNSYIPMGDGDLELLHAHVHTSASPHWPALTQLSLLCFLSLDDILPGALPSHQALLKVIFSRPLLRSLALPALECAHIDLSRTVAMTGVPATQVPGGGYALPRRDKPFALQTLGFSKPEFPIPEAQLHALAGLLEAQCMLRQVASPAIARQISAIRRARYAEAIAAQRLAAGVQPAV